MPFCLQQHPTAPIQQFSSVTTFGKWVKTHPDYALLDDRWKTAHYIIRWNRPARTQVKTFLKVPAYRDHMWVLSNLPKEQFPKNWDLVMPIKHVSLRTAYTPNEIYIVDLMEKTIRQEGSLDAAAKLIYSTPSTVSKAIRTGSRVGQGRYTIYPTMNQAEHSLAHDIYIGRKKKTTFEFCVWDYQSQKQLMSQAPITKVASRFGLGPNSLSSRAGGVKKDVLLWLPNYRYEYVFSRTL